MKHNENISLSVGPKHGELDTGKLLRSHVTLRTCLAAVDNCKQLQRIKSYSKKKWKVIFLSSFFSLPIHTFLHFGILTVQLVLVLLCLVHLTFIWRRYPNVYCIPYPVLYWQLVKVLRCLVKEQFNLMIVYLLAVNSIVIRGSLLKTNEGVLVTVISNIQLFWPAWSIRAISGLNIVEKIFKRISDFWRERFFGRIMQSWAYFEQQPVNRLSVWRKDEQRACPQAIWAVWKGCFEKMALYSWNKREFWTKHTSSFCNVNVFPERMERGSLHG